MIGRRAFLVGGIGGAALLLGTRPAYAAPAPPIPDVIDCAGWGARPASAPIPMLGRRPTLVIVHHTADPNTRDLSRAAADRVARGIQNFHMDARGWIDSGQHFTISRGGFVLEGRRQSLDALRGGRRHVVGAHCGGQNDIAVGIENEGSYLRASPPGPQLDRLRELCAAICARYRIAPTEIRGHHDYRDTACPGDRLYGLLPQLRVDVAGLLRVPLTLRGAVRPVWPLVRPGDSGETVLVAQQLLRAAGRSEVDPDGSFGESMAESVRRFQTERRTEEVNGLIGGETWPQLIREVRVDDSGRGGLVGAVLDGLLGTVGRVLGVLEWQRLLGALG